MIKLKNILNEVGMGPISSKGEKTIKIKHKTSGKTLVVVDTPASRKKYTRMGYIIPLPKHLKKLIKDMEKKEREFAKFGVKVKNVVVPGLEWMADLKEAYRPMLGKPQKDDWIRMPNGRLGKIVEVEARFHNDTLAWVKGPKPKKGEPAVFGYDLDDLKMSKKKGKIERKGKTIIWDFK